MGRELVQMKCARFQSCIDCTLTSGRAGPVVQDLRSVPEDGVRGVRFVDEVLVLLFGYHQAAVVSLRTDLGSRVVFHQFTK